MSTERIVRSFGVIFAAANPTFWLEISSVLSTGRNFEEWEAIVSNADLMLDNVFVSSLSDSEMMVGLVLAIVLVTTITSVKI